MRGRERRAEGGRDRRKSVRGRYSEDERQEKKRWRKRGIRERDAYSIYQGAVLI